MEMKKFNSSGLRDALQHEVLESGKPILGVCVGLQMFGDCSDEGELPGLGWIPGSTRKFLQSDETGNLPLPHMGWNDIDGMSQHPLLAGVASGGSFYFLHSYYFRCASSEHSIATCEYGGTFTCAAQRDNVFGVQFHPEKSHAAGLRLLKNFSDL